MATVRERAKEIADEYRADLAANGHDVAVAHIAMALAQAEATASERDTDLLRRCREHIESIESAYLGDRRSTVAANGLLAEVDARLGSPEPGGGRVHSPGGTS